MNKKIIFCVTFDRHVSGFSFQPQMVEMLSDSTCSYRITAGFVLDISEMNIGYKYAMFYHGDKEDDYIFGATLAVTFSNDLKKWD